MYYLRKRKHVMGVARIFQRGGHTDSYIGYSPNCHLNIVGCLLTKRLTKGGSRAPQDPPPLATPMHVSCFYRVIEARVEVWENEKCCENSSCRPVFPQLFRVLPNLPECFYLTNRFHVAVRLFSNRSQMTSKCGKNK